MLLSFLSANSTAGAPGVILSFAGASSNWGPGRAHPLRKFKLHRAAPGVILSFAGAGSNWGPGCSPQLRRYKLPRGAPGVILSFAGASSLGALGVLFRFVGFNSLAAPGRALPRQVEPPLAGQGAERWGSSLDSWQ